MAVIEQDVVFTTRDVNGNTVIQMPITRAENIENIMSIEQGGTGADNAEEARKNLGITDILLDYCYPVGSLYWSKNAADPGTLFGGTWERVKDTFILAAGDSYEAGSTGGEASHTLTMDEMPSHGHTGSAESSSIPRHIHGVSTMGNNNGNFYGVNAGIAFDNYDGRRGWNGSGGGGGYSSSPVESATVITSYEKEVGGATGTHTHTVSIASAGGGAAHNNMPPYATYYCWERTA